MTGQKLFYGAKFDQVVMLNRKAHIDFNVLKKKYVSEESIDLIKRMLTRESSNRISAEDALSHPYFNPNRLKLSLEEEEFSLQLKEFDSKGKINSPSIK